VFAASLAESLATLPEGPNKDAGIEVGNRIADEMLAWRANDGAKIGVQYTPDTQPGDWQRTFPDFFPPLLPQWPNVTPFLMSSPSQFRPGPPPALNSAEYAAAVDDVMRLGALDSTERTQGQTEIALFWADGAGTSTPAGHWNQIAADVAIAKGSSFSENAQLFSQLNLAMADAGIACWDAKYAYNVWRPIDAIRKADTDGNDLTVADPEWTPLLRTPPFPTYTSGHSTFSGVAEVVLAIFFGSNVSFTSRSDSHSGFTQRPLATSQIFTRSFTSFAEAAEAAEAASRSRIFGGIHFVFDSQSGLTVGRQIALASFS
jgi:hypothetical protein